MKLQPKNWSNFQHYKDRNPPWIKLHKNQLDKPAFMSLSLASVGLANMLWLLASETKDGVFDASMEHLTFRLRKTEREIKTNLKVLIDKGFFIVASGVLADDTKSCSEGEGETEGEKRQKELESCFESLWKQYPKKDGLKDAKRHFFASVKSKQDEEQIILALNNYCAIVQDTERKYIKNGSTWFNNWQDFIEVEDNQQDEYDWVT
jgi:hypothetical protein